MILDTPVLHHSNNTAKGRERGEYRYCTVDAVKTKSLILLSPEKLSRMWGIGLKILIKTLDETTHKLIRYT